MNLYVSLYFYIYYNQLFIVMIIFHFNQFLFAVESLVYFVGLRLYSFPSCRSA